MPKKIKLTRSQSWPNHGPQLIGYCRPTANATPVLISARSLPVGRIAGPNQLRPISGGK
jgi:hypothetical protein